MRKAKMRSRPAGIPGRDATFRVSTIIVGRVLFLSLLLGTLAGCESNEKKKAALTDEEIERLSYASTPDRPDELIVSGEIITCQDVMASSSEQTTTTTAFREKLVQLAKV